MNHRLWPTVVEALLVHDFSALFLCVFFLLLSFSFLQIYHFKNKMYLNIKKKERRPNKNNKYSNVSTPYNELWDFLACSQLLPVTFLLLLNRSPLPIPSAKVFGGGHTMSYRRGAEQPDWSHKLPLDVILCHKSLCYVPSSWDQSKVTLIGLSR